MGNLIDIWVRRHCCTFDNVNFFAYKRISDTLDHILVILKIVCKSLIYLNVSSICINLPDKIQMKLQVTSRNFYLTYSRSLYEVNGNCTCQGNLEFVIYNTQIAKLTLRATAKMSSSFEITLWPNLRKKNDFLLAFFFLFLFVRWRLTATICISCLAPLEFYFSFAPLW